MMIPPNGVPMAKESLGKLAKTPYLPEMPDACIELLERAYTLHLDPPGSFRDDRARLAAVFANRDESRTELFFLGGQLAEMYGHTRGDLERVAVEPSLQGWGFGGLILRVAARAIREDARIEPRLTVAAKTNAPSLFTRRQGLSACARACAFGLTLSFFLLHAMPLDRFRINALFYR